MCHSNLGEALRLVIRPKHLFRMVSFDVRVGNFVCDLEVCVELSG